MVKQQHLMERLLVDYNAMVACLLDVAENSGAFTDYRNFDLDIEIYQRVFELRVDLNEVRKSINIIQKEYDVNGFNKSTQDGPKIDEESKVSVNGHVVDFIQEEKLPTMA